MSTEKANIQPIIIKKIKKSRHGAHGGAWKIAYADFVTAMMAFFLMMWLLSSTSEEQKEGIADYFHAPFFGQSGAQVIGESSGSSPSVIPGGGNDLMQTLGQTHKSPLTDNMVSRHQVERSVRKQIAEQEAKKLGALQAHIEALIENDPDLQEYSSQINMKATPDGLEIQIVDDQKRPMFATGSAVIQPYMQDILRVIGIVLSGVPNRISIAGHTDATKYGLGELGYSNWELSADRANASRRELVAAGMPEGQLGRVMGMASSNLLDEDHPNSPINRRISLIVLTQEADDRLLRQIQDKNNEEDDSSLN